MSDTPMEDKQQYDALSHYFLTQVPASQESLDAYKSGWASEDSSVHVPRWLLPYEYDGTGCYVAIPSNALPLPLFDETIPPYVILYVISRGDAGISEARMLSYLQDRSVALLSPHKDILVHITSGILIDQTPRGPAIAVDFSLSTLDNKVSTPKFPKRRHIYMSRGNHDLFTFHPDAPPTVGTCTCKGKLLFSNCEVQEYLHLPPRKLAVRDSKGTLVSSHRSKGSLTAALVPSKAWSPFSQSKSAPRRHSKGPPS
jgi:hypothetical protein